MNTVIAYDAVRMLVGNLPSINPRPNFFNIRELRKHFAKALKKIPCPQSAVNGWAGAVILPEMYTLIDQNVFHLNIAPTTPTPAYPNKYNPDGALVPYSREEKSTIDAKFYLTKNYFETWKNIYHARYDVLDEHVNDAYKVAPPTTPPLQQDGTQRCLFATSLTSWHRHTESQHLTQCTRTMSTSWHRTIHKTLPKYYLSNVSTPKRSQRWPRTRTPPNNSSSTRSISSHVADSTNATLKIGNASPSETRHGSICGRSSKRRTRDVSHQGRSRQRKADLRKITDPQASQQRSTPTMTT
jgi:hypothetical protein